jgi:uncharacterized iron-regulated protein
MRFGLALMALLGTAGAAAAADESPDVATIVDAARDAEIVILGEIHDNPTHHAIQAEVVAALEPAALVFEMIPQARENEVNALRAQDAGREAIAESLDWSESGWPDFGYYAAILEAAPEARVFGAGQPRADVERATVEGAASVFGPDAATYGLDQPLPPEELAAREAGMQAAHCGALPPDMLPGMVEAQRFRDAGLADAALWARTLAGDGRVVVITGNGHADRRRGMPAALAVADPEVSIFSVGQFEAPPEDPGDYDLVVLAPAPDRGDPCAAFTTTH